MYWNGKTILVTGAGGFIGSHLVERLVGEGAKVRAFVRYNGRSDIGALRYLAQESLAKVEVIFGDLRDPYAVGQAVQGVSHVFHLGAIIPIPYSYVHPQEVVSANVQGTLNVLMACREAGVQRLVHTSTSEVYGSALQVPITEDHPLQTQSPYAASKAAADKLAESFYCAFELPVVTVRPFNTFGPRQSARAVIPTVICQALAGRDIRLGDLTPTRDFTYVTDTVAGFLAAGEAEGVEGLVLNLGCGREISVGDLAGRILRLCGSSAQVIHDPARFRPSRSEVRRLLSSNRRAKEKMGWEPRMTLDEGLTETIAWVRAHPELFDPEKYTI